MLRETERWAAYEEEKMLLENNPQYHNTGNCQLPNPSEVDAAIAELRQRYRVKGEADRYGRA